MKKHCPKCDTSKKLSEFNKNAGRKDGLQGACKLCQAAYTKAHYSKTKSVYIKNAAERRQQVVEWYKEYKSTLKCERCGESHPACLQFHHKDPSKKDMAVSKGITNNWSPEKLKKEIEKCEVVCANCHFKLHYDEGNAESPGGE